MLWWTLFVIAIGWLYIAWIPMMQRDNNIDPQEVLQDSQVKIDEVRTKLRDLQMQEADASTNSEFLDALPAYGR